MHPSRPVTRAFAQKQEQRAQEYGRSSNGALSPREHAALEAVRRWVEGHAFDKHGTYDLPLEGKSWDDVVKIGESLLQKEANQMGPRKEGQKWLRESGWLSNRRQGPQPNLSRDTKDGAFGIAKPSFVSHGQESYPPQPHIQFGAPPRYETAYQPAPQQSGGFGYSSGYIHQPAPQSHGGFGQPAPSPEWHEESAHNGQEPYPGMMWDYGPYGPYQVPRPAPGPFGGHYQN